MEISLSTAHKKYIRNEVLAGCVINALLAFAFTFMLFRNHPRVRLWGGDGIALDLLVTLFMLTLLANVAVMLITRKRVRAGRIPRLESSALKVMGFRLPRNLFLRALLAAVLMTAIIGPLSIGAFVALEISSMPFWPFVAFKMVYGSVVGALSAPVLLRAVLTDE
ncbi:hypothetical protein HP546_09980 [Pseudomonas sp. CM25]|uniref:hypothetical protein n=1 Tax=Pseudomonas sp. CM25 TaxID=2738448 RepID=UPI001552BE5B|nr:hypothetical protein [Pseudomonas sp. CM25]NQD55674.1 hypothetical protein [Pseudomonas sp. CM25]